MKTLRIHDVDKWVPLPLDMLVDVSGEGRHGVRVEFNTSAPTLFTLHRTNRDGLVVSALLGVIDGLGALEFSLDGEGVISADTDGVVWYFTNREEPAWNGAEFKSFTTLLTRRTRNREQERMMFKMEQNFRRLMSQQAAEQEAQNAQFREYLVKKGVDPDSGVVDETPESPADPAPVVDGADNESVAQPATVSRPGGDRQPAAKKGAKPSGGA